MITEKDLRITSHAATKMLIEGISADQVCMALERGSKFNQTDGYLCVYLYFSVAYKKIGDKYKIKTVYINK